MKLYIFYVAAIVLACSCYVHGLNVALGKPAWQTTTLFAYSTANKAVDGNDNKNFYSQTCMHTQCNDYSPASWFVDLGQDYEIPYITIANPIQSYGRLKNVKIEVFTTNPVTPGSVPQTCTTIGHSPKPDGVNVILNCANTLTGRYVKITKTALEPSNNGYCDSLLLCEVLVEGTLPVPPDPFTCDDGFTMHGGSCYHISSDVGGNPVKANWYNARVACRSMGADLAILDSQAENNYVKTQLNNAQEYWLGAQDFANGVTWKWGDPAARAIPPRNGNPGFEDWRAGYPVNANTANCLALARNGQWRWENGLCGTKRHYVCEKSPTWPN